MKPVFYLIIFCLSFVSSSAQIKSVNLSHYVFPEFSQGVVLMKSGKEIKSRLNYNSLSEEMVFDDKGKKLAIVEEQMKLIDTVYIKDRKFFMHNDKFFELVHHSNYDLYAEYRCRVQYPGKPDGHGGMSQVSSSTTHSNILAQNSVYKLELPEGFKTSPYTLYWIMKNGNLSKFKNMKQLMKLYNNKKGLFKAYVKKNDVKYSDRESIVPLINYLETN